jgi:hypothetical protein
MPDCSAVDVDPDGGVKVYSRFLNVEDACPWHAETVDSWIHLQPPVAHLSAGFTNFTVDANPSTINGRSGRIQIKNNLSGPGSQLCNAGFTPGILISQGPAASCPGVTTPQFITISGGPVTRNLDGSLVPFGGLTSWDGILENIGNPCSWVEVQGINSWLGYFVTLGAAQLGFSGSGPPNAWWFELQAGIAPNFWKKPSGSTPLGVYSACDQFGDPTPLTIPQTITIS